MTDFYTRVPSDLSDYKCIQTSIIKKKFLKYVSRTNYEEEEPPPLPRAIDWYPCTNSYYPYTEDVDAFGRVNHLLGSKPSFESLTSINDNANYDSLYDGDAYTEKQAQLQYLSSNPVSFLILGKPGVGEQELGKLLANYWQCVYIDPETLIQEEINSGTRAGQCIEFNLRCGRAVGVDVILRLVEKRTKSKSAQHRGFVICGFPLIPNDLYEEDPVSSESAVFNVKEIFEEMLDNTVEIGVPPPDLPKPSRTSKFPEEAPGEEEDDRSEVPLSERTVKLPPQDDVPLDIGSATASNICGTGGFEQNYEEQINFIFSQFQRPFLIIYIMCSNSDVVSKHGDYRFDFFSRQMVDLQREYTDKLVYTLFSKGQGTVNDEMLEDFIDVVKNAKPFDIPAVRQLVKLPRDFPANMICLLDRYRYSALPVIEKYVLVHDVQYFVKVDGRISPVRMFNAVKTKIRVLPLQRVLLPQKLLVPEIGGEGGQADDVDMEEMTLYECFQNFRKRQIASPMFKWTWSDWGTKCPVSMKEGDYKDGNSKYAVHFMNRIFFLSDEDAYIKFYRNPRPYLLPPYPKPSCRIFVMGPRCSGKTAVSRCLGYLLNGEVLDYNTLRTNFIKCKESECLDKIRSVALNEGIAVLNVKREQEWNRRELERQRSIQEWKEQQLNLLKENIRLTEALATEEDIEEVLNMSSFPVQLSLKKPSRSIQFTDSESELSLTDIEKTKRTIAEIQRLIKNNGVPDSDDINFCKQIIDSPEMLMDYIPPGLGPREYDVIAATIFDNFVKEFAENAVKRASITDVELTVEEISGMLIETINNVEIKNVEKGNNKGGWILDGLPLDKELLEELFPACLADDIFILKDSEHYEYLLNRFEVKGLNQFRDFRQFFMDLGKTDAAWRSPSIKSTTSYKTCLARDVVHDVLNEAFFIFANKTEDEGDDEEDPYFKRHPRRAEVDAYENELRNFEEDCSKVVDMLSEKNTTIIEVSVTGKSIPDLLKEVVKNIEDRYRQLASVFTAEERSEELEDFGEPDAQGEDMGEGEEKDTTEDTFYQNRRYGDTFNYCPVTFHNYWVLWKGKEEFAAKFENKLYMMCNEDAMNAFVDDPRHYLSENDSPKSFPPPRVCIVGPKGGGKTTVSKRLCKNLGSYHIDYLRQIKNLVAPKNDFELQEILKIGLGGENRDMLQNYLATGDALDVEFLNKITFPPWFEEPMKTFGFVLDGFPMRPSDVIHMTQTSSIPDIIIELTISQGEIHKRLLEKFVENWERDSSEKREREERIREEVMALWRTRRRNRYLELMELRRQERFYTKIKEKELEYEEAGSKPVRPYMEDLPEVEEETDISSPFERSHISYDSYAEEEDIEEVSRILDEEMPEPIFEEEIEQTMEEAVDNFIASLEESYMNDLDFLRLTRENCEAELIPWFTVDAGMSEEKVFAQVMRLVEKYKFRNNSLFERVYDISVELADKLLSNGFYFLSKFGKTCPVQVYENIIPVQMYLPLEQQFQLFPVIHRQYIYFLSKKENRDKFKEDPLKYITQKKIDFPLIPFKLAIIGPPKSGKTALAERFKRELGLKLISLGQAGRYVLNYLQISELARNMESVLRLGWELTPEMMIKCVEAMAFDGRSVTQGFVFDGFPTCISEVRHLAEVGLIPQLVIDLQADEVDIKEFLAGDTGKRNLPRFSQKFIDHRYKEWLENAQSFREWLDNEYQIVAKMPVKPSKWGVWTKSYELSMATFYEIKHYHKFYSNDCALRLANMQITPLEFIERKSVYKHYCPCCLHYDNALVTSGDPPDRTGLVQFRKYYYYLCPEHIREFVDDPERFLSPYNNNNMPEDLPVRIFKSQIPENCFEDGICIICYWENQPRRVIKNGNLHFMILYKEKFYLFDHLSCMNKFMRKPHKYYSKTINFKGATYPSLDYYKLPVLGLLQQYDVKQLTRAVVNTGILRPIIPGLSPEISASLNMAFFLKLNNPKTPHNFLSLYEEAQSKYNERRLNLINYLGQMKKMINPYLYYDEPLPKFVDPLFPPPPPSLETVQSEKDFEYNFEEMEYEEHISSSNKFISFRESNSSGSSSGDFSHGRSVGFKETHRSEELNDVEELLLGQDEVKQPDEMMGG